MNPSDESPKIYGLMAEFDSADQLIAAAKRANDVGFKHMDAYSPLPVEGLLDAIGDHQPSRVPRFVLGIGVAGALGAAAMQVISCVVHYPLNIGGKGYFSWPAFIPVTYELTILSASVAALIGMLFLSKLPMHYHPVFNVPRFERASREGFFLCLEAADPLFDLQKSRQLLEELKPVSISEVPA